MSMRGSYAAMKERHELNCTGLRLSETPPLPPVWRSCANTKASSCIHLNGHTNTLSENQPGSFLDMRRTTIPCYLFDLSPNASLPSINYSNYQRTGSGQHIHCDPQPLVFPIFSLASSLKYLKAR